MIDDTLGAEVAEGGFHLITDHSVEFVRLSLQFVSHVTQAPTCCILHLGFVKRNVDSVCNQIEIPASLCNYFNLVLINYFINSLQSSEKIRSHFISF